MRWTEQEKSIITKFYKGGGWQECIKHLPNRNKKMIFHMANKMGIRQVSYNENYFQKIDTIPKSYWLGFIFADGCVTKCKGAKGYNFSMKLKDGDYPFLCKFSKAIGHSTGIRHSADKSYCYISIRNDKLCDDLIKLGVVTRKTYIDNSPVFSKIPKKYHSHFVRGYFDGDGTVGVYYDKSHNSYRFLFSILCQNKGILQSIKSCFDEVGVISNIQANKTHYKLNVGNKRSMVALFDYLYKDSDNNNRMNRKYKKFVSAIKNLNN
ncbi:LAGLIDADG family homing endonuclease [Peribacillus sp. NPDC096447]|uniref:LAGLIDADG family homing endonuclease n=1 Tax=Peribacillus sp. NPDC096447 TaxID=3364394 RepID=UPI00380C0CBA